MTEYKLDNGWLVRQQGLERAILYVLPLENSIFRKKQDIELTDEVFQDIQNGETSVTELFRKHELHNVIIQWENREPISISKPENTETKYFGNDFIVMKEKLEYYMVYELSSHGGGIRKIPIPENAYFKIRKGNFSLSEILDKYELHHLDTPANDLK